MEFFPVLKSRNELLFYFGLANFVLAGICITLGWLTSIEVAGANAWHKPTKFALSIGMYSWTMGWLMYELPPGKYLPTVNWLIVVLLGLEILYIAIQAGRGERSHFNLSTPFFANMYTFMAVAAAATSCITLFIGIKFFTADLSHLPDYYIWGIRLGLILFVVFSLEGFVMGSRLSHTIGGPDGGRGLPFLNWSRQFGDPRVAHFVGMHALQVLPILAFYVLKDVKWTIGLGVVYASLAVYVLWQALRGIPFLRFLG